MNRFRSLSILLVITISCSNKSESVISVADFGLGSSGEQDATEYVMQAVEACRAVENPVLLFPDGVYNFYPSDKQIDTLFISAHDHVDKRYSAIKVEGIDNLTIEGSGSRFIFHKYQIPLTLIDCHNPRVQNFSIDFAEPNFTQAAVAVSTPDSVIIRFRPGTKYSVRADERLYHTDDSMTMVLNCVNEFVGATGAGLEWNSADQSYRTARDLGEGRAVLYGMRRQPVVGNTLFFRNGFRPNPGIFSWRCSNMNFKNVTIHWALGMGMLSQRCDSVSLDNVNVALERGSDRCFTTIDAIHFTACKGLIRVENGLYENMLDDAINVHGDYLKIAAISPDRHRITISYGHRQSFGYEAVGSGERLQFVKSTTMLTVPGSTLTALTTNRVDAYQTEVIFTEPVDEGVVVGDVVENMDYVPQIIYRNNTIRNNRARGALFSSPSRTLIEGNRFENCSGSAILLSSDCNDWYLSGACHDLVIRDNDFVHCMSSLFQYCESVISIYPEIKQQGDVSYHSGIIIENNLFTVSEPSVLYARSVDSLVFRGNRINYEPRYKPILDSTTPLFKLVDCVNVDIYDNDIAPELTVKN